MQNQKVTLAHVQVVAGQKLLLEGSQIEDHLRGLVRGLVYGLNRQRQWIWAGADDLHLDHAHAPDYGDRDRQRFRWFL